MNLWTGMLRLAVTEPRTPRIERIDQEIELRFRVSPLDIDYNLHMNNAKYLTAMELTRIALMKRAGLVGMALRNRWVFANAAQQTAFFLPLKALDRYTVSCRVFHVDADWLFLKQQVRRSGRLAATGLFKMAVRRGRERLSPLDIAGRLGFQREWGAPPREILQWEELNGTMLAEMRAERSA